MRKGSSFVSFAYLVAACCTVVPYGAQANEHTHQYAIGDKVTLWVNKVGPYNNPQETYNYYTLPFCKTKPTEKINRKWSGLGEVLEGNELIDSQIDVRFRIDAEVRKHPLSKSNPANTAQWCISCSANDIENIEARLSVSRISERGRL